MSLEDTDVVGVGSVERALVGCLACKFKLWYASSKGLRDWQRQLRVEHSGKKQVSGLFYATNMDRPRLVKFPVYTDPDNPRDATGWVADVELNHWFPHGTKFVRVDNLPGSGRLLKNRYTVVVSRLPERAPRNNCVLERFGRLVWGNVLGSRKFSDADARKEVDAGGREELGSRIQGIVDGSRSAERGARSDEQGAWSAERGARSGQHGAFYEEVRIEAHSGCIVNVSQDESRRSIFLGFCKMSQPGGDGN
ncbi:hypothetical protein L226DRAFT_525842 [Lentinus tigrinus ALCF2SS1-7]|uniref:Uncharacterized protein n=1 Tax=Lentinus tigrinus ALCF2SS1-6 TaxID=1328759 RepID=A0A5C2RTD6_9APHY|nr:hypothetical protein L227DRAFT_567767 [Lentinus tigrinus ALCF2SS1-6]RPD70542.1 hypothetical protein L226DRAFT_525842 [Lentinus tigrinus ALCF2SS1-7]